MQLQPITVVYHDKNQGIALVKSETTLVIDEDYIVADERGTLNFNYKWRCVKETNGLFRVYSHTLENQRFESGFVSVKDLLAKYENL